MNSWFFHAVSPAPLALAVVLSSVAPGLLYHCWRTSKGGLPLAVAWGLIGASPWSWMQAFGFDRGAVMALLCLGLGALLSIASQSHWREALRPATIRTGNNGRQPSAASWRRRTARWLLAGPLSLLAVTALTMGWFAQTDWREANRLVAALLSVVLLWPVMMTWSSADPRLWRPLLANGAAFVIGCSLLL